MKRKKNKILLLLVVMLTSAFVYQEYTYRMVRHSCFRLGERMEYRVHYGFLNAGIAVMTIYSEIQMIHGRPCYKIEISGESVGFFDFITHIEDVWVSYLDTAAIVSQQFYQTIHEGKYKKKEVIEFDHPEEMAIVHRLDKETGALKEKVEFQMPENTQDMVSGYYWMRTFDYDTIAPGDSFIITGFYDDTVYHVKMEFLGREILKTKAGKYNTLVVSPEMPENQFFSGKNPVRLWMSDDKYKIPLKVKADLVVGAVVIDITMFNLPPEKGLIKE